MRFFVAILFTICVFSGGYFAGKNAAYTQAGNLQKLVDSLSLPVEWSIYNVPSESDLWVLEVYRKKETKDNRPSILPITWVDKYWISKDTLNKYFSFMRPIQNEMEPSFFNHAKYTPPAK